MFYGFWTNVGSGFTPIVPIKISEENISRDFENLSWYFTLSFYFLDFGLFHIKIPALDTMGG